MSFTISWQFAVLCPPFTVWVPRTELRLADLVLGCKSLPFEPSLQPMPGVFMWVMRVQPRVSYLWGKHSTDWAVSQTLGNDFMIFFFRGWLVVLSMWEAFDNVWKYFWLWQRGDGMLLVLIIAWESCSASCTVHGCLITTVKIYWVSVIWSAIPVTFLLLW